MAVGHVTILNSWIVGCKASNVGGALLMDGVDHVAVSGTVFESNAASSFGGAVSLYGVRNEFSISKCEFVKNSAKYGSAIMLRSCGRLLVRGSLFWGECSRIFRYSVLDCIFDGATRLAAQQI